MIYLDHMINIVETDELEKKIQLVFQAQAMSILFITAYLNII
jgi:hypothetical protein